MNHGGEEPEVRHRQVSRPGGDQLHRFTATESPAGPPPSASRSPVSVYQSRANTISREVTISPVSLMLRSFQTRPILMLPGFQVAGRDQVLRSHEPDSAVDHEQLAVVAQVRSPPSALQGLDRQHRMPLDAGGGQPLIHLFVPRIPPGRDVVVQQSNPYAPSNGVDQRLEELVGDRRPRP